MPGMLPVTDLLVKPKKVARKKMFSSSPSGSTGGHTYETSSASARPGGFMSRKTQLASALELSAKKHCKHQPGKETGVVLVA